MTIHFGTMLVPQSATGWTAAARAAEQQGYHTLMMPDTLQTTSPFPAFAAAAAVTTSLRLRPNVLAAPLRTAATVVRETAALQTLSDGRFELGIGVGRPGAEAEAQRLGLPWGSPGQRRAHLTEIVEAVRAEVDPVPTVMVAAAGPRMLTAAAGFADRILTAVAPQATEQDVAQLFSLVRDSTDRPIPFTSQLIGVGERTAWTQSGHFGAAQLRDAGSFALLPADPEAAADILREREEKYGIDEMIVPGDLAESFAPILERLG